MPGRTSRSTCRHKRLETLKKTRFNKLRMGVFPKDYPYNVNEPLHPIFLPGKDGKEDFDRPNPVAFRHFEKQVAALRDLGIEADIIIFHPYDRWGYCNMSAEQDFRYVAYLAARLAAYRNVWWSLANEYDFLLDYEADGAVGPLLPHHSRKMTPTGHLKSIHNGDVRHELRPPQAVGQSCLRSELGRQADVRLARGIRQAGGQ